MSTQRIQLDDLLAGITPYEPTLMRIPQSVDTLYSEDELTHAAAKTAQDILSRQGVSDLEITDQDAADAQKIFEEKVQHIPNAVTPRKITKPATALKLEALVAEYDYRVIQHQDQIRFLVTNKLVELSDHKDPRIQIKAVELLGKLADVGMFVEKQEITYKQQSDDDLKKKLQEKLGLLIEGEIVGETIMDKQELKKELQDPDAIPLPSTPSLTPDSISMLLNS